MRRVVTALVLSVLAALPASAQERDPPGRQVLMDLAYVLGEAHALRQVCAGPDDQFWRNRMMKMLETEGADQAFDRRLRDTFNTGYAARQSQFTECSPASRQAERRVAQNGRQLARRMTDPPPAAREGLASD